MDEQRTKPVNESPDTKSPAQPERLDDLDSGTITPEQEAKVKGGLGTTRRNEGIWEN